MTVDEIRELIKLATETGIAELEVQRGDNRVRIRRAGVSGQEILLAPQIAHAAGLEPAAFAASAGAAPVAPSSIESSRDQAEKAPDPNLILVRSPIVGTFYEGPSPDAAPFVSVGERVQPGKVLCIIESMKLMNEIEAEITGTIENRLVNNGQPVEYGEALFAIRAV
jgi:acetyl-CoA carboxylase biotin carboxyl carrier protein